MRNRVLSFAWASLAALLAPSAAWATHPDHEGERGLELQLNAGLGVFTTTTDELFLDARQFAPGSPPREAIRSTGFALRGNVGWRLFPFLSAGVQLGWQTVSGAGEYSDTENRMGARDTYGTFAFGAYARFYYTALFNGAQRSPRVFFQGLGDLRRLDAWFSVGVDFVSGMRRARAYESDPQDRAEWSARYVGVPLGFGADYRITQPLAVGLSLVVTPMVSGTVTRTIDDHTKMGGVNQTVTTTEEITPATASNVDVFFGVTARYTWTPW